MSARNLRLAIVKLGLASAILNESLAQNPEYSLTGERAKELMTETRSWLADYVEEVTENDSGTGI